MAGIGELFGEGSSAGQFLLWNVGSALTAGLLAPVIQGLQNGVWTTAIADTDGQLFVPLSPADLADMVIRNYLTEGNAAATAAASGMTPGDFSLLVATHGQPPGAQFLADITRKGVIEETGTGADSTSFEQGIAEGDTKDKWAQVILDGTLSWPTVADTIEAYVRGQLTEDEAQTLFQQVGGNPAYFTLLYNTAGRPPGPADLLELTKRKLIPQTGLGPDVLSLQQGIAEGDTKNKWFPAWQQLLDYIPPPRTVTTLLRSQVIDQATAEGYWEDYGLSPELAQAYAESVTAEKVATAKSLAESTVLKLYAEMFITADVAKSMLATLGYDQAEAEYLIDIQDFQRALKSINAAVTRVGNLFVNHKIDAGTATTALQSLGLPDTQVSYLTKTWALEQSVTVKLLTPTQIADGYAYGALAIEDAIAELQNQGYTAHDAWVLCSVAAQTPAPNEPAQTINPIG